MRPNPPFCGIYSETHYVAVCLAGFASANVGARGIDSYSWWPGAASADFGPGSCSGPHWRLRAKVAQPPVRTIEPPIEPPAGAVSLVANGGTRAGSAAPSVMLAKSQIPHPTDDVMPTSPLSAAVELHHQRLVPRVDLPALDPGVADEGISDLDFIDSAVSLGHLLCHACLRVCVSRFGGWVTSKPIRSASAFHASSSGKRSKLSGWPAPTNSLTMGKLRQRCTPRRH